MNNETPSNNPYVNNLVEMGYDRADCEMVAAAGRDASYPRTIYGRTFDTKAEYDEAVADYIAGLWRSTRWHTTGCAASHPLYYKEVNQTDTNHA